MGNTTGRRVEAVLQNFRYGLLTPEELTFCPRLSVSLIPTVLGRPSPTTVFDCFFYWQD